MASRKGGPVHAFQSTPPRGGRLICSELIGVYVNVSIHAPARGATEGELFGKVDIEVSIHAPARGAT